MAPKKITVKSLSEADPIGYAPALSLRDSLRTKSSELGQEETDILFRLNNAPPLENVHNARVSALLGDEPADNCGALSSTRERLSKIHGERRDLQAALEIAEGRLAKARHRASAVICEDIKPAYTAAVKDLAAKLIEADAAHRELLNIIDGLNAADISWTVHLHPMQARPIFGDHSGKVATWLREAARAGFITKSDIPKELQQ